MTINCLNRHLIAIFVTIIFYKIPTMAACILIANALNEYKIAIPPDFIYWPLHAAWSPFYIVIVYNFASLRITYLLIIIEIASILLTISAYIQWFLSLKSQWFYANFEHIMTLCFILEIAVIIIGATHGGILQLYLSMRKYIIHAIFSAKTNILGHRNHL
jgi:hypothetical protein